MKERLVPYVHQIELIPRTKDERIAELEIALKEALAIIDSWYGHEGEPSDIEKKCRQVLRDALSR